ncbi:MAG: S8 family serine peptidase [Oligoflexia bacterium]|nr:S8 family serine peptidase [Oligoflexia bacterium]
MGQFASIILSVLFISQGAFASTAATETFLVGFYSDVIRKGLLHEMAQEKILQTDYIKELRISVVQAQSDRLNKWVSKNKFAVRFAEKSLTWKADQVESAPLPKQAKGLWAMKAINAGEAWEITRGNRNIIVAVTDTGTFRDHRELKSNLWVNVGESGKDANGKDKSKNKIDDDGNGYVDDLNGFNFVWKNGNCTDDHYHGTHVAGTIGATEGDNSGIMGVIPEVSIMTIKFLNDSGHGKTEDGIKSIIYAVNNGAKVINASWGGDEFSQAMADAIEYANSKGVLFAAAAGNSFSDIDKDPHYPASFEHPNVITVGASSDPDDMSFFSCYGKRSVDLAAPGSYIYSTFNPRWGTAHHEFYEVMSGTSMATPHVAGAAALVWAANPSLSHLQVKEILISTVAQAKDWNGKSVSGGILNLGAAVKKAKDLALK